MEIFGQLLLLLLPTLWRYRRSCQHLPLPRPSGLPLLPIPRTPPPLTRRTTSLAEVASHKVAPSHALDEALHQLGVQRLAEHRTETGPTLLLPHHHFHLPLLYLRTRKSLTRLPVLVDLLLLYSFLAWRKSKSTRLSPLILVLSPLILVQGDHRTNLLYCRAPLQRPRWPTLSFSEPSEEGKD